MATVAVQGLFSVNHVCADEPVHKELPAVSRFVTCNGHCFVINGQPTYLFMGQMEYLHIPRELWRDRLLRMKQAGYNAVTTYVMWNAHEPKQGEYHFEDNLDLDAYLKLIKSLGMYAFVRVGPFVCAEWENGGYPAWLNPLAALDGKTPEQWLRKPYSAKYSDVWFKKLMPIVAQNQIQNGGAVIMCQVENEYGDHPSVDAYCQHLSDNAVANGMAVPWFYSGRNHSSRPFPQTIFPTNTWMCTEFWTGWISRYGEVSDQSVAELTRDTWRLCACGTAGFSHYMACGGTFFGYTADEDQWATSYDYSAPIGEAGTLRKSYYGIKFAGLFTRSFNDVLANSVDGRDLIDQPGEKMRAFVNSSQSGNVAFIENNGAAAVDYRLKWKNKSEAVPKSGTLHIAPNQVVPFIADYPLPGKDAISYTAGNVLSLKIIGQTTYLVCYGDAPSRGEVCLQYATAPATPPPTPWVWDAVSRQATLGFAYPAADSITESSTALSDGKTFTVLAMNTEQAKNTWITDNSIISGAHFVVDNQLEFPLAGGKAIIYSEKGRREVTRPAVAAPVERTLTWRWSDATPEAQPSFDDAAWETSPQPQEMASYGWANGYGWYRAAFTSAQAGQQTLSLPRADDQAFVFWNGKFITGNIVDVKAGKNTLAILVGQYGRNKFGRDNEADIKARVGVEQIGISTVWGDEIKDLSKIVDRLRGQSDGVSALLWQKLSKSEQAMLTKYQPSGPGAEQARDVVVRAFNKILGEPSIYNHERFRDELLRPDTIFLKEKHPSGPALAHLNRMLLEDAYPVELSRKPDIRKGPAAHTVSKGLVGEVKLGDTVLTPWRFKGGFDGMNETGTMGTITNWTEFLNRTWNSAVAPADNVPKFWRCDFSYEASPLLHTQFIITGEMRLGVVWLNGHCLGRSKPTKSQYPLYVPECWLKPSNVLVVLYDDGTRPQNLILTPVESYGVQTLAASPTTKPALGGEITGGGLCSSNKSAEERLW